MNKKCRHCEFYEEFDEGLGICYRYPPVFVGREEKSSSEEAWDKPTVHELNWCGEFKPKTVGASIPVAIEKSL